MHVYPSELADLIIEKWDSFAPAPEGAAQGAAHTLPAKDALENLISTCYQVSMMREEGEAITLRVILADPQLFPADQGPPKGFLRMRFATPQPLNAYTLRNLSPAVDFERSLIGVEQHPEKGFRIWGVINSGIRWLQEYRGGSRKINLLPESLVLHLNGPGRLTLCKGDRIVATLSGGRLLDSTANPFRSTWIQRLFEPQHGALMESHEAFRASVPYPVARIHKDLIVNLQFQILKRIISVTRRSQHGGTFIIFPSDNPPEISSDNPSILLKYKFQDDEAVHRQQNLLASMIRLTATALGDMKEPDRMITWKDYVELRHVSAAYNLVEAFYEHAQFVARLASVDGVVVVCSRGVLGFGGMIVGSLDILTEVAIAHDAEGTRVTLEKIESYGSRHRSAYHLCNDHHQVMAIVVSQDGNARLAKWRNGIVTCWPLTSEMFVGDN